MQDMDLEQIKETDTWELYEQARNFCRMRNMFTETDVNYRMYNGDQWSGLKIKGIEPVQLNFIKPIVRYKVGVLHSNLYAINYSSDNFESQEFREEAEKLCDLLNKKAAKIWDRDSMDIKCRKITKDAAINSEGVVYSTYANEDIVNEIIKKNNIYFGNENDSDIQSQPYILIKQRRPIAELVEKARADGISEEKIKFIIGDNDTFEESGDSAKQEKDLMCTVITKMWKEKGTVHYQRATRWVELKKDTDSGLTLYPIAHFLWEDKEGDARGEGEVKHLIPNQLETNKNFLRSIVVAKNTAYPQKVARKDKIINPSAINEVGGTINVTGTDVDDVSKIITTLHPAQMSSDVEKLRNELIQTTRELAGAGDIATGQINPEQASGKAILAVQQASQQPITEQLVGFKTFVEDIARIWLDIWTTYSENGIELEEEVEDPSTGEKVVQTYTASQEQLEQLKASVKVDITPKGAFDKFAQEASIENLLKEGFFNIQRLPELKAYANVLDDDSVMPKQKLLEAIKFEEQEQQRIAEISNQAEMLQQKMNTLLNSDPEAQAGMLANAAEQEQAAM